MSLIRMSPAERFLALSALGQSSGSRGHCCLSRPSIEETGEREVKQ